MTTPAHIIEIPGLIQHTILRKIAFANEGLTIEKSLRLSSPLFVPAENIAAFRFGVKDIHGYKLSLGRQYYIEIRDYKSQIFNIKLNAYYGINRKIYYKVWAELLQKLWDHYIEHQLDFYKELFDLQQSFELAGVTFQQDGITWDKDNKLQWNEIAIRSYQNYFMLYHTNDPGKHKYIVFSMHWNAVVLQSLLKSIMHEQKRAQRTIRRNQ